MPRQATCFSSCRRRRGALRRNGNQHTQKIDVMNRRKRPATKDPGRRARKNASLQIVAVHEAGHAVAKVLSFEELGYSISRSIDYIDIGAGRMIRSADGTMVLCSQGITFGPMFSKDIASASQEFREAYPSERQELTGHEAYDFLSAIVELGRAADADIDKWFRARVFDAVTGSIAEAIISNRSFSDVWNGYECEGDRLSIVSDAKISRITGDEALLMIDRMAALSAYLMETPAVWAAVLALANKLPGVGRMNGAKAVAIITSTLSEGDVIGMFAKALERITEIEQQMSSAEYVVAKLRDGSTHVIKGGELLGNIEGDFVQAVQYDCTFPVFAETLCLAFGDGALQKQKLR
jgi:hypothetical protein